MAIPEHLHSTSQIKFESPADRVENRYMESASFITVPPAPWQNRSSEPVWYYRDPQSMIQGWDQS